jgi:catechol 2,3-dioxygenase-like lactoylglutathione lyase family enzyme
MSHESLWIFLGVFLLVGVIHVPGRRSDGESGRSSPRKYVEPNEQLIVEIYVRNVRQSAAFYEKLGFKTLRSEPEFVELAWEDSRLFLEQIHGQPAPPRTLVANIRILVPDVDRYWKQCVEMKLPVAKKIDNRVYGLRDFTVVSPDGVGLRFASKLSK